MLNSLLNMIMVSMPQIVVVASYGVHKKPCVPMFVSYKLQSLQEHMHFKCMLYHGPNIPCKNRFHRQNWESFMGINVTHAKCKDIVRGNQIVPLDFFSIVQFEWLSSQAHT